MKQEIYSLIKDGAWAMWAGVAVSLLFNIGVSNWKFWAFMVPLVFLVAWMKY